MTETAKHETLDVDPSASLVANLEKLNLKGLSFIQLRRLQKILQQSLNDVVDESARRSAEDNNSGDTVRVPSPKV